MHDEDDPLLAEPICRDCFDHAGALAWNNALGELWRRTTIYLPRVLARITGSTHKQLRALVRVSYIKVAEYQRRGLVHLHAVIRLDRAMPAYRAHEIKPPPARFTAELLADAIRAAAGEVSAPLPDELGAYLSPQHRDQPADGCPPAALLDEIARRPAATRQTFTDELLATADDIAARLDRTDANAARTDALTILGSMIGTLQLARALTDPDLSDQLLTRGVETALKLLEDRA